MTAARQLNRQLNRSESKIFGKYSICICGAKDVGKTAIFSRVKNFVDNVTSIEIPPYSGTDMVDYPLAGLKEDNVTIQLFDSPGGMTGDSMVTLSNYYRSAACIVLVYDVTDWDTLTKLIKVYKYIQDREYCPNAKYVILRNKIDMIQTTQTYVSKEEESNYILSNAPCLELHGSFNTSAETNVGIREFFMEQLVEVLKYVEPVKPNVALFEARCQDKKSCC